MSTIKGDDKVEVVDDNDNDDDTVKEDWDKFKWTVEYATKSPIVISDFFLIMELARLVPYVSKVGIKFHPLNMPNIRIGKIEIVGYVTNVKENEKHYELLVEDGTGALKILYDKKYYAVDRQMIQTTQLQTSKLRKDRIVNPGDYINAFGYCALDFPFGIEPKKEITFDILCASKLFFSATKVKNIEEADYNKAILTWNSVIAKQRGYCKRRSDCQE